VADVFKPHRLTPTGAAHALHGCMHHARWGNLSLNLLDYGGQVAIEPGPLEHFYLLQIPLRGDAEIECGAARFVSSPDTASLLSPTLPVRMQWGDACPQVILRVEREVMERHARRHFGDEHRAPVEFEPEFSLASPQGACLAQMLPMLADAIATDGHPLRHPLAFEQLESTLLNLLLYGHPNSARNGARPAGAARAVLRAARRGVHPRASRRAADDRAPGRIGGREPEHAVRRVSQPPRQHADGVSAPVAAARARRIARRRDAGARVGDGHRARGASRTSGGSRSNTSGRSGIAVGHAPDATRAMLTGR
jgi:hypothetical protein